MNSDKKILVSEYLLPSLVISLLDIILGFFFFFFIHYLILPNRKCRFCISTGTCFLSFLVGYFSFSEFALLFKLFMCLMAHTIKVIFYYV